MTDSEGDLESGNGANHGAFPGLGMPRFLRVVETPCLLADQSDEKQGMNGTPNPPNPQTLHSVLSNDPISISDIPCTF